MRIEVLENAEAVAVRAADIICDVVRAKPAARLGLPTGNTPIAAYNELNRRVEAGGCDFSVADVYAIDEFCDATRTTPGTNTVFYKKHLRIRPRALHCPNPAADDPGAHIAAFAEAIRRGGGLDLCVLGIGETGHIAFNEPGSGRDSRARVVMLTEVSRQAHAGNFGSLERVPLRGMTLGVADLLEARAIVVMATGVYKADVVRAAIEGPMTAEVPASWLQGHTDVVWLLDREANSGLAISS
jgi:glucosamine-6-phosphate deaminase